MSSWYARDWRESRRACRWCGWTSSGPPKPRRSRSEKGCGARRHRCNRRVILVVLVAEIPVEYASQRKIREYNKLYYRFNHWPIWIFVFFIAPGPLTFDLFEHGFKSNMAWWLLAVLAGTGIAGLRGALPGVGPKPDITP